MSSPNPAALFGAPITQGGLVARLAEAPDMAAVLRLRARAFRAGGATDDRDRFDGDSLHLWVGRGAGDPLATIRIRPAADGAALAQGYAAQVYDLRALAGAGGMTLELGRLCTESGAEPGGDAGTDADSGDRMRLLWAGVTRLVLATGAARLIGCTSFPTTDVAALSPGFALLAARHLGPEQWRPGRKAAETVPLVASQAAADPAAAIAVLPPLLRAYLSLGGWVSDHAVIDRELGTCHVFTCVEVAAMPAARRRVMERIAAG